MTNFEKIKQMSVDDVAALIMRIVFFTCESCERKHNASCSQKVCFEIHKQWLESEAGNEQIRII